MMEFPETFTRLAQFDTKEKINIRTNKTICQINKSLAAAISPIFFNAIKAHPLIEEIFLPINENIEEFFKGKSIDKELFLRMSIILDNQDFIKRWKEENEINKDNVIQHLMKFIQYRCKFENMEEEIKFINNHFEELEKNIEFDNIPSEYLIEIIKNVQGIEREEKLFKYIMKRLKEDDNENNRKKLIESIEIKGLRKEDLEELIKNIKYEELSEDIFSRMKNLFILMVDNRTLNEERVLTDIIEELLAPNYERRSEENYSQIIEFFEKSENKGNDIALNNIGDLYRDGYGVDKDYSKAMEFYQKSAEKGNSDAIKNIGNLYRDGYGVKQDYSKAMEYYEKAEEKGNAKAINNIGNLYYYGYGVKKDFSKAKEYYFRSAEKGNPGALNNIGDLYRDGEGVEKDYSKAIDYYTKAADKGNAAALNNIGNLYRDGKGVEKDYSKAMEYYLKSADIGIILP